MSKLTELRKLAEALVAQGGYEGVVVKLETILQMLDLIEQMREALHFTNINGFCAEESCHKMEQALAAFEKFDKENE